MKQIAYLIVEINFDNDEKILAAFWNEPQRNEKRAKMAINPLIVEKDIIVDMEPAKKAALSKLDGLEKLVLGLGEKQILTRGA